jgi:hypothetical protein
MADRMRGTQGNADRTGLIAVLLLVLLAAAIIAGGLALDAARTAVAGPGATARSAGALVASPSGTDTRGAR